MHKPERTDSEVSYSPFMRPSGAPESARRRPLLGAGSVLRLIRDGEAVTRADLARRTGLARSTVAQRVDALLAHELVYEAGGSASTGGRPPTVLAFNQRAGVVLAADLGATHSRLAVSDLAGAPLAEVALDIDIADGPGAGARAGSTSASTSCCERGRARRAEDVRGIGVGVPGPGRVRDAAGRSTRRSCPAGTASRSRDWFASRYDAPVLVDNDVNIMALGEHWTHWRDTDHLLFVKVGTGIGCGIVAGRPHPPRRPGRRRRHRPRPRPRPRRRHLPLRQRRLPRGRRRRPGARRAADAPRACEADNSRDVVAPRARRRAAGDPRRPRGRPRRSARCSPAASTSSTRRRSSSAATSPRRTSSCSPACARSSSSAPCRSPRATCASSRSRLGDRAGVVGAAIMVIEHVLAPDVVDRALQGGVAAA